MLDIHDFNQIEHLVEAKIEQVLPHADPNQLTRSQMVRIEALNIASREAVVRSYAQKEGSGMGKTAVEIAQEMVGFIEELDRKEFEDAEIREESIRGEL